MTFLFVIISLVVILILLLAVWRNIQHQIRSRQNQETKRILRGVRLGSFLIVLSPILFSAFEEAPVIGPSLSTMGLILLIYYYHQGGTFLLQGEHLRRLIIVNKLGLPIYSYYFSPFQDAEKSGLKDIREEDKEALFSGAISSIISVLAEITGTDQLVREIWLDNLIMMVRSSGEHLLILFVDRSTRFYRDALRHCSHRMEPFLNEIILGHTLTTDQCKIANSFVEEFFGHGYYQQIGSMDSVIDKN